MTRASESRLNERLKKAKGTNSRQQTWRDRTNEDPEKSTAHKNKCALAYRKKKNTLLSEGGPLFVEHCVDQHDKKLIHTPVGFIRYSSSNSHFAIRLKNDCIVLNMKGNGAYGLVVRKGLYCYKLTVASQDGKGDVKLLCVENFYDTLTDQDLKNNTKLIRCSKSCSISFEKSSLRMLSKIKDLRYCIAPYVGMLALRFNLNLLCYNFTCIVGTIETHYHGLSIFVTKFAGNSLQKWSLTSTLRVISSSNMFNVLMDTIDLFHTKVFVIYM